MDKLNDFDSKTTPVEPTQNTRKALEGPRVPRAAKILFIAVVLVLGAALVFVTKTRQRMSSAPTGAVETDPDEIAKRPATQDFILTDEAGAAKKFSDFRGNVVILSFWASWCAPCLEELPTFAQLAKRYHGKGLVVLPVNVEEGDEGKKFAKNFWSAQKFGLPSYYDTSKALASQFQIDSLPANFVFDRQGRQAFSGFGANDWTNTETVEFLEGLLAEKP